MQHPRSLSVLSCLLLISPFVVAHGEGDAPAAARKKLGPLFSHEHFDNVLHRHVKEGRLNYEAVKGDKDFAVYIDSLADAEPDKFLGDDQRVAFWINVFNACVIKGIVDRYPVRSVKNIAGFWTKKQHKVAGARYSLNDIEALLKKRYPNPKIAFTLCRGSVDGPQIPGKTYGTWDIGERLEEATDAFINSKKPVNVAVDKIANRVTLSKLFAWYDKQFVKSGGVDQFISLYLKPKVDSKYLIHYHHTTIFFEWNWSLNDARS